MRFLAVTSGHRLLITGAIAISALLSSSAFSQPISFHPEADTIIALGGCTPPAFLAKIAHYPIGTDTVFVVAWASKFFIGSWANYDDGFDTCYFAISNASEHHSYELWCTQAGFMEQVDTTDPWGTGFQLGSLGWFTLTLRVFVADQLVDSLEKSLYAENTGLSVPALQGSLPSDHRITVDPSFPNPFNGQTVIQYYLFRQSAVRARVFDLQGRVVFVAHEEELSSGTHVFQWHPVNLPSGSYIIELSAGGARQVVRVLYLK